jgi:hypothetical protein
MGRVRDLPLFLFMRPGRLKAGCRQNCLPHKGQAGVAEA